jgi:hypothetical protein
MSWKRRQSVDYVYEAMADEREVSRLLDAHPMLLEDLRVGRLVGLGEGDYIARDWEPVCRPHVEVYSSRYWNDGPASLTARRLPVLPILTVRPHPAVYLRMIMDIDRLLVRRLIDRHLHEFRDRHDFSEAPLTGTVVFNDGALLMPHLGPARMLRQYMAAWSWSQQGSTGSRQGGRGSKTRGGARPCIMSLKGPRKQRTSKAASKW